MNRFGKILRAITLLGAFATVTGIVLISGWSAQQMENLRRCCRDTNLHIVLGTQL